MRVRVRVYFILGLGFGASTLSRVTVPVAGLGLTVFLGRALGGI